MIQFRRAPTLTVGVALMLVGLTLAPAWASHYRMVPGFSLVTEPERVTLQRAGVQTTSGLLKATSKRRARRTLSKSTGISFARLTELATQCDLLRVNGLGPSGARLLQAARIRHTGDLRQTSANRLHGRLEGIRSALGLSQIVPEVAELQNWITQAKRMRKVLEGVR